MVRRASRPGSVLFSTALTELKTTKNRMHLDMEAPALDEEVTRLESLGARRLEEAARSEHGMRWIVMADPEGNEFCVCTRSAG